ncbi:hypothetical protein AACH06_03160 [Ideonella sp. DXS29W]|uniref:Right handed beta helix domain-containing protein n=1 Tax=Ideonella lacteola TaxID=2984193 RepID=A0ABU9BME4_9BURK
MHTTNTTFAGGYVSLGDVAGSNPDGVTLNDLPIQNCIDDLSSNGGGTLWIPKGRWAFSSFAPKSNVTISGMRGASWLVQVQPKKDITTGIYKAWGSGALKNFHLKELSFDGGRVQQPLNPNNDLIRFALDRGDLIENISITDCDFQNAQNNFIQVLGGHPSAQLRRFNVMRCSFVTTPEKVFSGSNAYKTSMDAVRIEQTYDYSHSGDAYGTVLFRHINIADNYAETIRTLADLKRGCAFFTISRNSTRNMSDCHHSVDGSFNGSICGNTADVEVDFAGPSSFTNFIEVQGEQILVTGNQMDGGHRVVDGIFITDYGRPEENGEGHRSIGVQVSNNHVSNVTRHGIRVLNNSACTVTDNTITNAAKYGVSIESGTGRTGPDGVPLVSSGCAVGDNQMSGCLDGVSLAGTSHVLGENTLDGRDALLLPSTLLQASKYGNFRRAHAHTELNPNPHFRVSITNMDNAEFYETSYPAITAAKTKPDGVPQAVVLTDSDDKALTALRCSTRIAVAVGDYVYGRVWIRTGTATSLSVFIQEQDASGAFISNTFYAPASVPSTWTEYVFRHKIVNGSCAKVAVHVAPASGSNVSANTGTSEWANLRLSRTPIGFS